jgi:quinol monooxygenase YgiN
MKTKKTDVIVVATARAKAGKEADLEAALREAAAPTREQQGCVQFLLLRATGDQSTMVGFERWASEADHQKHLKGAHIHRLMSRMADLLAAPPSIVSYEAIDE